jgi:hypothetical protein
MRRNVVHDILGALAPVRTHPARLGFAAPTVEPRLEPEDLPQLLVRDELAHCEEVAVPPPVLEGHRTHALRLCDLAEFARLRRCDGERLVDHDVPPRLERRPGQGIVRRIRRTDRNQLHSRRRGQQLFDGPDNRGAGISRLHALSSRGVARHHGGEVQSGRRCNEWRVEGGPAQAEADEPDFRGRRARR